MTNSHVRFEPIPEVVPARDFFEALVARYESQVHGLKQQGQPLLRQFSV